MPLSQPLPLPAVSLILPLRNEERFITRCLDSILSQDYLGEMELLVVDGKSTDRTPEIVKEMLNGCHSEPVSVILERSEESASRCHSEHREESAFPSAQSRVTSHGLRSFRLLTNEKEKVVFGLNQGIKEAKGEVVVRADGHAVYAPDYVSKCIEVMGEKGAGNVGGVAVPVPVNGSAMAGAIALAHLSPFGLGGAKFRIGKGYEGPVDTVWPGCWRKETFLKLGGVDERFPRTEDIQFNQRLREAGHKVWLSPRIRAWYFCRGTLGELWKQNWANGRGIMDTLPMNRKAIGLRHLVPLLFVLSLLFLSILSVVSIFLTSQLPNFVVSDIPHVPMSPRPLVSRLAPLLLLAGELGLYLLLSLSFSLQAALRSSEGKMESGMGDPANPKLSVPLVPLSHCPLVSRLAVFLALPVVFATLHLSYGLGSLVRLLQVPFVRKMWK